MSNECMSYNRLLTTDCIRPVSQFKYYFMIKYDVCVKLNKSS
jgi:hypothetical protein